MVERDEIVVAGLTHQGMIRKDNQDSYGFIEPESPELLKNRGRLFIVADGLGGHRGGKVASKMAVDIIGKLYYSVDKEPIYPALLHALEVANRSIFETSSKHEELQGMATTCTALVIQQPHLYMAHVGDSRAYLVRGPLIQQISEDHSLVNEQIKAGMITPEEAKHSRYKNIITRSVGFEEQVEVDVVGLDVAPGDQLVLCCDGLTNLVEDEEILETVTAHGLNRSPELLVGLANDRGGDDNITVIVVKVGV